MTDRNETSEADTRVESYVPVHDPRVLLEGTLVGRFVILSKLGSGAMGVVYSAYDPELDRKVALKLLRPGLVGFADNTSTRARMRILREAQALAKLSHPNVVAIHDVGLHEHNIWLAMEFVDGCTFREWMQVKRTWPEVLKTLLAAGHGLAAAHQAKLMHRDFKPDNIMVGPQNRVRVMDLGLARTSRDAAPVESEDSDDTGKERALLSAEVTQAGSVLGTPAYMAPEQLRGEVCDARSDIFAFCVTLWEALHGKRPFAGQSLLLLTNNIVEGQIQEPEAGLNPPGWIRRICIKGFASDPNQRWQSLDEVLRALEQGLARMRWRRSSLVAGCVLICTLLVLSIYELSLAHARQACSDEGATIETVWNEGVREQLRTAFLATGSPNAAATVENVPHYFDTRATEWREVRTEICVHTTIEKDWSSELTNKGLWCLVQHKVAMDELLKQLLKTDVENIHNAVRAASKLRESSNCSNPFYLYTLPKLPHNPEIFRPLVQQLQRTEAVLRAGNFQEAEELAQATLKNALKVERSPLIARAYLSLGTALSRTGKYAESEKALEEAFFRAVVDDAYEIAADATIALMDTVGQRMVRFDDGLRWWRQFEAYDTHLEQQSTRIRRGHALGALAGLYFQNGDYSESITTLEKSLQIRRDTQGEEHPYYASGLINLSLIHETMGHYDEALALGQRALEIKQKVHGEKHPSVVNALVAVAERLAKNGGHDVAKEKMLEALSIVEGAQMGKHWVLPIVLSGLGRIHHALGEEEQAKASLQRALSASEEAYGKDHVQNTTILEVIATIEIDLKNYQGAQEILDRILEIRTQAHGPEHPTIASVHALMGDVAFHKNKLAEAWEAYERALAIWKKSFGEDNPKLALAWIGMAKTALEYRQSEQALELARQAMKHLEFTHASPVEFAQGQMVLAQMMWAHEPRAHREQVLDLLSKALEAYHRAGGKHAPIREIDALLKKVERARTNVK